MEGYINSSNIAKCGYQCSVVICGLSRAIDFWVQVCVQVGHPRRKFLPFGPKAEGEMALTDTALKAFKPRDKPYIVSDDRGLYVEVFPTGGIVWRFRYRLNGKREKLTLGKY